MVKTLARNHWHTAGLLSMPELLNTLVLSITR